MAAFKLYKNHSPRLKNWDYGSNGYYFITICTQNKSNYFGEIVSVGSDHDPTMELLYEKSILSDHGPTLRETKIGEIATQYWNEIPEHFRFVELDSFVIMPNHIHGVLKFNKTKSQIWTPNQFGSPINNLGSVIRQYKGSVKRFANKNELQFSWQNGYHDHVIHTIGELHQIRNYIHNNPQRWLEKSLKYK